jgi:hypothetical protein
MKNDGQINDIAPKEVRKLTQLLSTHGEYMTFSSYYLWFLIDEFHLVIDDVIELATFSKNTAFNTFVETLFTQRVVAKSMGQNGLEKFLKMILNSSYGYDILNTQHYNSCKFLDDHKTLLKHEKETFISAHQIKENFNMVQSKKKSYTEQTCIQCGFFTLDYAKYWYLNFIYNFLYKCCDVNKFHFIEGDTDSIYIAVSGDFDDGLDQTIKHIITDMDFYNDNKDCWTSSTKELLKVEVEAFGDSMVVAGCKNYNITTLKGTKCKHKGVSKRNTITKEDYNNAIEDGIFKTATNVGFQLKKVGHAAHPSGTTPAFQLAEYELCKTQVEKNGITGIINKSVVLKNNCCAPFVWGHTSKQYIIAQLVQLDYYLSSG